MPGRTRYDYDVRIGDAERDATMALLREHFVAGRLTFDELTERIDATLTAKTQGHLEHLMADLPRPPRVARAAPGPPVPAPDAGRYLILALLLFALATWILIMAWMSRHAYVGQYPHFPGGPGGYGGYGPGGYEGYGPGGYEGYGPGLRPGG